MVALCRTDALHVLDSRLGYAYRKAMPVLCENDRTRFWSIVGDVLDDLASALKPSGIGMHSRLSGARPTIKHEVSLLAALTGSSAKAGGDALPSVADEAAGQCRNAEFFDIFSNPETHSDDDACKQSVTVECQTADSIPANVDVQLLTSHEGLFEAALAQSIYNVSFAFSKLSVSLADLDHSYEIDDAEERENISAGLDVGFGELPVSDGSDCYGVDELMNAAAICYQNLAAFQYAYAEALIALGDTGCAEFAACGLCHALPVDENHDNALSLSNVFQFICLRDMLIRVRPFCGSTAVVTYSEAFDALTDWLTANNVYDSDQLDSWLARAGLSPGAEKSIWTFVNSILSYC